MIVRHYPNYTLRAIDAEDRRATVTMSVIDLVDDALRFAFNKFNLEPHLFVTVVAAASFRLSGPAIGSSDEDFAPDDEEEFDTDEFNFEDSDDEDEEHEGTLELPAETLRLGFVPSIFHADVADLWLAGFYPEELIKSLPKDGDDNIPRSEEAWLRNLVEVVFYHCYHHGRSREEGFSREDSEEADRVAIELVDEFFARR